MSMLRWRSARKTLHRPRESSQPTNTYKPSPTTVKPGALFLRKLHDSFKIQGLEGEHLCLVHEPLGVSAETFQNAMPAKQLPEALLKAVLEHLLQALDCLHSDAKMIHTGKLHIIPRNSSQDFFL
jgi:hypothetical protein